MIGSIDQPGIFKRKALSGFFYLGARRILLQLILTGSNIILARILLPTVFGTFAIVSGIVSLFGIFSSLGLETALIQKKGIPKKEELQAAFTITLFMSLFVALIIFLTAPVIFSFYRQQLGEKGVFYLRIFSLSLIILGLKGVSTLLLERSLDYFRIVTVEVLEMAVLELTTIILALKGFGVLSFILGFLVSRFFGFVLSFILAPWPIGLRFSFQAVKKILPFGINYQLSTITGGLNGAVVPIFVGKVSGPIGVGLLNWAGGLATFPRAVCEILGRLVFPVCSRTQDNKKLLKQIVEKSIQLSCLTSFPLVALLVALARPVTYLVYTDKWLAGIPALYFFSLQSVFIIIGGIIMNTLLALGEVKIVRNVSLFWMVLQWVLTVPLVFKFGFVGLAAAGMLVSATFFVPLIELRKKIKFEIGKHVWPYLVYSLIAGGVTFWLNNRYPVQKIWDLFLVAGLGGLVYLTLVIVFKKKEVEEDIGRVRRILFRDRNKISNF